MKKILIKFKMKLKFDSGIIKWKMEKMQKNIHLKIGKILFHKNNNKLLKFYLNKIMIEEL
jgi:hypothetical protein